MWLIKINNKNLVSLRKQASIEINKNSFNLIAVDHSCSLKPIISAWSLIHTCAINLTNLFSLLTSAPLQYCHHCLTYLKICCKTFIRPSIWGHVLETEAAAVKGKIKINNDFTFIAMNLSLMLIKTTYTSATWLRLSDPPQKLANKIPERCSRWLTSWSAAGSGKRLAAKNQNNVGRLRSVALVYSNERWKKGEQRGTADRRRRRSGADAAADTWRNVLAFTAGFKCACPLLADMKIT